MISIEKCRELLKNTDNLSEEEIIKTRESFYDLGHLIFDDWLENEGGSKYPTRVLQELKESNNIKS